MDRSFDNPCLNDTRRINRASIYSSPRFLDIKYYLLCTFTNHSNEGHKQDTKF